jgi:hypothetical protein
MNMMRPAIEYALSFVASHTAAAYHRSVAAYPAKPPGFKNNHQIYYCCIKIAKLKFV